MEQIEKRLIEKIEDVERSKLQKELDDIYTSVIQKGYNNQDLHRAIYCEKKIKNIGRVEYKYVGTNNYTESEINKMNEYLRKLSNKNNTEQHKVMLQNEINDIEKTIIEIGRYTNEQLQRIEECERQVKYYDT